MADCQYNDKPVKQKNDNSNGTNIKKIAKLVGVDPSTVSRALNGSLRVKPETRERIEKAARETGYIPHSLAKSLIEGKTFTLGILVPEISSSFFARIIDEIENEVSRNGYGIILAATNFQYQSEAKALKAMLSRRVDALVVCSPSEQILKDYQEMRINVPMVLCDTIRGDEPYDSVYVDEKRGFQSAVKYLAGQGHRDIGFIAEEMITQHRLNNFVAVLEQNGLRLNKSYLCVEAAIGAECGYMGMKHLLLGKKRPTAVLCARDTIAIGALRAAHEKGLTIPGQISIIGYDDISISRYLHPALTTIRQPTEEVGRNVGEMVLKKLNSKSKVDSILKVTLIPELIVRESSGKLG
jgi:LacI family transcriptional regulator